jgi:acyl-CoA reductase-like NAD-dependent aldehyde dehydrogenase
LDYAKLYINGEFVVPSTKELIEVENPATKEVIARVPRSNEEDINFAIKSAKDAFKTWQFVELETRIQLMENLIEELSKREDEIADMILQELGKGMDFALKGHTRPYIEDAKNYIKIVKEYEFEKDMGDHIVRKEPIGVVAALTPWNYPLGQVMQKVIPALLTGNTIVLKPSQNTPLVTYILAEAIDKVGYPKGVFNLITGAGSEVGNILVNHKDVNMVTFTGSTDAGKEVAKKALDSIKRITLELGGKSPALVLPGADKELAVKQTLNTVYNNAGQTCSAYTRMIIPEDEKEEMENLLVTISQRYNFGDPTERPRNIGPVISQKQFNQISSYIQKGIDEGAKIILGEVPKGNEKGYYINPVIFTDVDNNMTIAREEIFGPVLCLITYKDIDEAIEIANDTDYGLSAGIFGPEREAREVANKIKAGYITINKGSAMENAPFGGFKQSGLGREGGIFGIEEFLEVKAISK